MVGQIHLEWNELEKAEAALRKCLELSRFMAAGDWQANSSIALSRLQLARGNLAQAFAVLDQMKSESPRAGIAIRTWKIRLSLVDSGEHPDAMNHVLSWAAERSLQPFEPYRTSFETLTLMRVLIAQHRLASHATSKALPHLQVLQAFLTMGRASYIWVQRLMALQMGYTLQTSLRGTHYICQAQPRAR